MEHPAVTKRSDDEANKWRESVGIKITGNGIPKPVMSFEEASMPGMNTLNLCSFFYCMTVF
jgi:ATP-dependent RNA helicase DDX5/DBP2